MKIRRKRNVAYIGSSGMEQVVTEMDCLLRELIEKKEDFILQQAEDKRAAMANEAELVDARKRVEKLTLQRKRI
ncbi:hypothetical protein BWQ96_00676 [Gracilariopsis chorda]|uniref:Uncharacterized protein n=1 Tax=Gracilariopsis chorda TaxID=448386 RepID=A0A2V3J594_9FLOR|nr:hypothetical protein BWQ96_00676 [Gracilariopsis chorda]|eukprot:PXF49606.1 hypothetical protein BWQ96_00676 [Gracilariopsis chorda]